MAARRRLPQSTVIAFEPLPAPADRFHAVFAGDAHVMLHEAAIGPRARRDDYPHLQARRLLLPLANHRETERALPRHRRSWHRQRKIGPLSDFIREEQIEPPALLKLDVQGFELQALQGCESLLHRFAHVYAECSFVELYVGQALADEVIAWLRERGFTLSSMHNPAVDREGQVIQADFLFARTGDAVRARRQAQ